MGRSPLPSFEEVLDASRANGGWASLLDAALSPSEVAGRMDKDLATVRNQTPKVVTSRIRVLLNRPLTWAEKEDLETDYLDEHLRRIDGSVDGFKVWVSPNHEHVWAEASFGSRILFEVVTAALESGYVNVFPRAVRTFREYNGE